MAEKDSLSSEGQWIEVKADALSLRQRVRCTLTALTAGEGLLVLEPDFYEKVTGMIIRRSPASAMGSVDEMEHDIGTSVYSAGGSFEGNYGQSGLIRDLELKCPEKKLCRRMLKGLLRQPTYEWMPFTEELFDKFGRVSHKDIKVGTEHYYHDEILKITAGTVSFKCIIPARRDEEISRVGQIIWNSQESDDFRIRDMQEVAIETETGEKFYAPTNAKAKFEIEQKSPTGITPIENNPVEKLYSFDQLP